MKTRRAQRVWRATSVFIAWFFVACTPKPEGPPPTNLEPLPQMSATATARGPMNCAADASRLREHLETLRREGQVLPDMFPVSEFQYEDRPLPTFAMAKVEAPPASATHGALVILERGQLRFGDRSASIEDRAATAALFRTAAESGLSAGFGSGHGGREFFLRMFRFAVGESEPWRDVVSAVDAAVAEQFTVVSFLVEAKSAISPPPSFHTGDRMVQIATQRGEMPWKRDVALHVAFRDATSACAGLAAPFFPRAEDSAVAARQLDKFFTEAASVYESCGCNVESRVIEAFGWVTQGRHWGRATVELKIDLGSVRGDRVPPMIRFSAGTTARFEDIVPRLQSVEERTQIKFVAE